MLASLAGATAIGGINNMLSEFHANKAHKRQLELMEKQNAMNNANNVSAYIQQVHGMKMAGLNPASLEGGSNPNVSAAVSQGAGAKGENVEMDPLQLMLRAQVQNLDAQTAKIEQETKNLQSEKANIEEDTSYKMAQRLLAGANTDKVSQESQAIKNANEVWQVEKGATALFGQTMAKEWQKQPWYSKLDKTQKMVVDDIASGEYDLHPGSLLALEKSIKANSDLSESLRSQVANNFANYLTEAQFNDPKVKEALVKSPETERERLKAEVNESYKRAFALDLENKWTKDKYDVYQRQDVDKLYNDYLKDPSNNEKLARWLHASAMDKLSRASDMLGKSVPAYVGGKAASSGLKSPQKSSPPEFKNYKGSSPEYHFHGVQNFRY